MTNCLCQNVDQYDFASLFVVNTPIHIIRRRGGGIDMQVRCPKVVLGERIAFASRGAACITKLQVLSVCLSVAMV